MKFIDGKRRKHPRVKAHLVVVVVKVKAKVSQEEEDCCLVCGGPIMLGIQSLNLGKLYVCLVLCL